jgi:hypothetical protein
MASKKNAASKSSKPAVRLSRSGRSEKTTAGESLVTIDRRRGARGEAEGTDAPVAATTGLERRKKVQRRRQIDPTTCERDYSAEEIEFMNAMDEYKRKSGRMFPTCSEVLEVIRNLGYVKLSTNDRAVLAVEQNLSEQLDAVTETVGSLVDQEP